MKPAEMARRVKADKQCADRENKNVTYRSRIEVADGHHEKVGDGGVEKAPQDVDRKRGKTFAGRLCEGRLEGPSHNSANEMRHDIGQEQSSEKVRHKM